MQASSRIKNLLEEANFDENDASKMEVGSQDGAWYTGFNGTYAVTISQILMKLRNFLSTEAKLLTPVIITLTLLASGTFTHRLWSGIDAE